ncbi:MAG: endolytic transglycosylase MltG, partial [Beijerinckiaceae bacterium]|nr:endolytic transglycosylase MltG [Beijerinckiaceae bacterium]
TGKADERPRVASVFLNRLKKGMPLQSDPTIVYGLAGGKGSLGRGITRAELDKQTPYNTYLIQGLPPGPIANPGRAALDAVANPSRTQELYFVADGTGGHVFSETLEQHSRNVQRWRQIERDAKDKGENAAPDLGETAPQPPPAPAQPDSGRKSDNGNPASIYGALPARIDARAGGIPVQPSHSNVPAAAAIAGAMPATSPGAKPRAEAKSAARLSAYTFGPGLDDLGLSVIGDRPAAAGLDGPVGDGAGLEGDARDGKLPAPNSQLAEQITDPANAGAAPAYNDLPDPSLGPSNSGAPQGQDDAPPVRARAFDASQGTPRDPLRNKTYDLNYAKTVPAMR